MQTESHTGTDFLSGTGPYRQLIENLQAAVYTCDIDGHILQYNKAAVELWGRTPIPGKDLWCGSLKVFNVDGSPLPLDKCPMAIAVKEGRRVDNFEIIIERPDGRRLNVMPHPQPLTNMAGKTIGAVNMLIDITRHHSTEERLRESEDRLRLAIEGTQLTTWDLNLVTKELIYSHRLASLFGHDELKSLNYRALREQIHPDDKKIVDNALETARKSGNLAYEARILRPDNSVRWIRTDGKILFDDSNVPIRMLGTILDITDKREVAESIEKLAAIVESSDDAIVSITTEGVITSWNMGANLLYGYSSEEMLGRLMNPVIPKDRHLEESEILERIKKGEKVEHYETIRVKKNGEVVDVSLTVSPIKDSLGTIIGASKSARNISKQKQAERSLIENEQKLQIVIEASQLGTWELNVKTGEVSYSKRYLEILGYSEKAKLEHGNLLQRLYPEDLEIRDKAFEDAFKTGRLYYVSRLVWADETIHWIEARGKVFYDEQNNPLRVIGTVRDITEEKSYQQDLMEKEQRFRTLANAMPQFIWTSDQGGNLNYFNEAVFEYSGLTFEQINKEGWLQIVHPDDREENIRRWFYSIQSGEPFLFEHRFRRKDGEYRWQMSRATPQRSSDGKIQMWIGTSTDIHDRKLFTDELEERVLQRTSELHQRNEDLVKSNIELGQFAYVASHDLQEPIRKILTFSTRIMELEGEKFSETGKDYFKRMQLASSRMRQLIMDLLTYSRTSTAEGKFEEVDLTIILNTVLDLLKETIDQKKAEIKARNLPTLTIIPYQFEQLLTNILSNALKFSRENVAPVITISADIIEGRKINSNAMQDELYHRIIISDNGIGFDQQFSDRIFQVFQRLHGKDEYAGTGIGLSIVKKIVENHNGIITTESALGKGASFVIHIPISD